MLRSTFILLAVFVSCVTSPAAELTLGEQKFIEAIGRPCPVVKLWPEGQVPDEPKPVQTEQFSTEDPVRKRKGILRISNVFDPSFIVIAPPADKNTGAAFVLCPGGGYGSLGAHSVRDTAEWMNARGIAVVLLKYRVPKRHQGFDMNHQPLQDAQRAFGILRARAAEWNIDPQKIGIGGFSAGGHLVTTLCTTFDTDAYKPIDAIDRTDARPDFAFLIYPAYLTDPINSNEVDPLLQKLRRNLTPPMFTTVARDDRFSRGLLNYFLDLQKAKLPAELHVYSKGGHGGGIDPGSYPFSEWPGPALRWLADIQPELDRRNPEKR